MMNTQDRWQIFQYAENLSKTISTNATLVGFRTQSAYFACLTAKLYTIKVLFLYRE